MADLTGQKVTGSGVTWIERRIVSREVKYVWISARQRQANRNATVEYLQTTDRSFSAVAGISFRNAERYGMSQTLGRIHHIIF